MESLDGEHKQVTVLCAALAEAPTLAARLGPEAMYHLMRDVLALAQETVQRYDGTIIQISGEGFLALFGAPVAQEDHARRAVLAAFELRQWLRAPDVLRGQLHGVALRLGLASGPLVVGPLVHEPQQSYTAAGAILQLATQLQQQAAPDTLLVSAATYTLVQDEVQGEAGGAPGVRDAILCGARVYAPWPRAAAGGRPPARRPGPRWGIAHPCPTWCGSGTTFWCWGLDCPVQATCRADGQTACQLPRFSRGGRATTLPRSGPSCLVFLHLL